MRLRVGGVGDRVDVEEARPLDAAGLEVGARIAPLPGHVPGGIQEHEVGRAPAIGMGVGPGVGPRVCKRRTQPFGTDQRIHVPMVARAL